MNFKEAAKLAMRDTAERAINSKAYKAVDRTIDDASYYWPTYWDTEGPMHAATYLAVVEATHDALEEARYEL